MKVSTVVFFCMPERGHFQRLVPVIRGLAKRRFRAHVFTHRDFEGSTREAGGVFVDLFDRYPLHEADAESLPVAVRYVSFAGRFLDDIRRDVEALRPSLIVYDTFAVVGPLVGEALGIPYVNVCAGHKVEPSRYRAMLSEDPRVALSDACHRAVDRLRERHGFRDASPFSYVCMLSPFLNLYGEPPAFLDPADRRAFEPLAFFGSLSGDAPEARRPGSGEPRFGADARDRLTVYVSFGTVVWRYYEEEALAALEAVSDSLGARKDVNVVIGLGGTDPDRRRVAALVRSNVRVESFVDQWNVLGEADRFVTHQGLNSTHEAIWHQVPMISCPFFWDQPALAAKCRELDLAVPLTEGARGAVTPNHVEAAFEAVNVKEAELKAGLARAFAWEKSTIAGRHAILDRIAAIASRSSRSIPASGPIAPRTA